MQTPTIVVSGTSSGVGKTTVALGLMHTFRKAGLRVQPFKVGPDFLDGMQHETVCGVPSINLDGWMMGRSGCITAFHEAVASSDANIAIVEGCMGLHDGRSGMDDDGSTAQVAKWLGAPVLLVVDAWSLARSAAAMVHGYATFDAEVHLAGVLFNRVAGPSHAEWLRQAMTSHPSTTDVEVVGCLPVNQSLVLKERLLGLLPPGKQHGDAQDTQRLNALHRLFKEHVNLALLRAVAARATPPAPPPPPLPRAPDMLPTTALSSSSSSSSSSSPTVILPPVRIAVARDAAFCFLYHDNLRLLAAAGATLLFFSPLADAALPLDADALYLIGGYPELHAAQLHANSRMKAAVRGFCQGGGFVWAECGGLMYLAKCLVLRETDLKIAAEAKSKEEVAGAITAGAEPTAASSAIDQAVLVHEMCGVLPFDVAMTSRMVMGYCVAKLRGGTAALLQLPEGTALRCQQYHFSEATVPGSGGADPCVVVDPRTGRSLGLEGVEEHAFEVCMEAPNALPSPEGCLLFGGRTVATYCHVHFRSDHRLATRFVGAARRGQTVASLLPSGTEMVAALLGSEQAKARLVGVSEHCDWPPGVVRGKHVVSRSAVDLTGMGSKEVDTALQQAKEAGLASSHALDVDWLREHRPAVVLTQDSCPACGSLANSAHAALEVSGLGKERALTLNPCSVAGVLGCMRVLGGVLGQSVAQVEKVVGALEARLKLVAKAVENEKPWPRVLGFESVFPLVASGQWLPDMRRRAGAVDALLDGHGGGENEDAASGGGGGPARVVDLREVANCRADAVVICCCGRNAAEAAQEVGLHLLTTTEVWGLPGLAERGSDGRTRLFVVDHDAFSRPGPRLVDGIETLCAVLHPSSALPEALRSKALKHVLRLVVDESAEAELEAGGTPNAWHFEPLLPSESSSQCAPSELSPDPSLLSSGGGALVALAAQTVPATRCAASLVAAEDGTLILFGGESEAEGGSAETAGVSCRPSRGLSDCWSMGKPSGGWVADSCPAPGWDGPWECGTVANEAVPTARSNHASVACGDHLLVFGGWSSDGSTALNHPELLHLDTRCWTHCSSTNDPPPPRGNPTLVYSRRQHLAICYGGWDRRERLADVWCLDMERWAWHRAASESGDSGDSAPAARTDHTAALWVVSGEEEQMLVFGGSTKEAAGASDELWALNCSSGAPAEWRWALLGGGANTHKKVEGGGGGGGEGPWPPPRTSHAAAIAGKGASASLVVVSGQDSSLGPGAAAIVADAWVLAPLGSAHRTWSRLDWRGTYPLQRCRHSLIMVGGLAVVYGGFDGVSTVDEHHSVFCAPLSLEDGGGAGMGAEEEEGSPPVGVNRTRRQERWEAERPLTELELPAEARGAAASSRLPLAMAKALHRHALKVTPPRDTYIDPDTGYSVFTQAYLKRRPCCGNSCRHCPFGHINVPRAAATSGSEEEERPAESKQKSKDLDW